MKKAFLNYLKTNYSVFITVALFTVLQLFALDTSRPIMVDEAWYSNPAYNFVHHQTFENTNMGYGGNFVIMFLSYLTTFFYVFGTSLFVARMTSVVAGIISILLMGKTLKIIEKNEFYRFLSLSFFIFANLYLSIFKLTRPEALAVVFSLCVLITTYYYIKKEFDLKILFLLIVFNFLSLNSHPNSSIIVLLSFLVILYFIIKEKKYKRLYHTIFLVAGVALSILCIMKIISLNNNVGIYESIMELRGRNTVKENFIGNLILKVDVTKEYFISSNRIITFIPQLLVIIAGLFFVKRNKKIFGMSVCGILSLCIAFVFLSDSGFMYVFPYIFIFSPLVLAMLLKSFGAKSFLGKIVIVFTVLVIVLNLVGYVLHSKNTYDPGINKKTKEINAMLPENSLIISEAPYWFISPPKSIKSPSYLYNKKMTLEDKDFYIISCDKFMKDYTKNPISLCHLNTYNENHNIDTLLIKESKIYGKMYLVKYTKK